MADGARILLELGADPRQLRDSVNGASRLQHLAVAGPNSSQCGKVVKILLRAGADINATNHRQWIAMHAVV